MFRTEATSNTWSIHFGKNELIFWQRAASSVGRSEGYRHATGFYACVCVWGWMVSLQHDLPERAGPNKWAPYFRTYWRFDMRWFDYNCGRGGAFTRFNWGRRLAKWRADRAKARRLLALQTRKNWWEARGGMWWEFDRDETRSYYKFLRAIYKLPAAEAWARAKEETR